MTSVASDMNNVPMQGMGQYSSNAALQHEAMLKALPFLEKAAHQVTLYKKTSDDDKPVTIMEYGSAHGNNSIRPLEQILQSVTGSTAHLLLCDRPENDFNSLSCTISKWIDTLNKTRAPSSVFLSMVPRSFYQQVVPTRSVDLAFSLACLHHLERMPPGFDDASDSERKSLLQSQSQKDLHRFLRLRASELRSGGMLTLSFVSQSSSGRENYAGLVDSCRRAMVEMVHVGELPLGVAGAFKIPTYDRTLDDVNRVVQELADTWKVHDMFEHGIVHPAIRSLELAKPSDPHEHEHASEKYAKTVADWLMAVCAGYFLKAVSIKAPDMSAENANALLSTWVTRTRKLFMEEHRDEEVFCSFIYVLLERT